ncbi:type II toxin-antitoxin system RelE/ParE family toxin [Aetokthonos hydrillicola Thurmond2011]|uniref:Type II toxin-antitoxin system RelE/ParE family toxin n=1 Tax=Aetokthonos hydrillicola Thurmond2011 TaxID=2712845 RepID=A0AAP5MAA7_9CYAN|nr:type II toxin-antitoxin system RelE/ParE family toxin [Aetokthonos hydrillicola]MDR9895653.1 type II toxin-antitoxin system RelE/ParE family toxin [Aetokthonos hydrillicola Thurmond2011]
MIPLEIKEVVWLGDSRKNMQAFPKQVRIDMGAALMAAQCGETAAHVKPFKGVGSGVFEIAERYSKDAYRLIYAVQIGDHIYVLHAFQKKSKSGIATPKQDVDLIRKRYKEAQEHASHD